MVIDEMLFSTMLIVTGIFVMGALVAYVDELTAWAVEKGWL